MVLEFCGAQEQYKSYEQVSSNETALLECLKKLTIFFHHEERGRKLKHIAVVKTQSTLNLRHLLPKQILGRSAELQNTHDRIVNFRTKLNSITEKLGCHFLLLEQSRAGRKVEQHKA